MKNKMSCIACFEDIVKMLSRINALMLLKLVPRDVVILDTILSVLRSC